MNLTFLNKTLVTIINNKNKPYYLINYQLFILLKQVNRYTELTLSNIVHWVAEMKFTIFECVICVHVNIRSNDLRKGRKAWWSGTLKIVGNIQMSFGFIKKQNNFVKIMLYLYCIFNLWWPWKRKHEKILLQLQEYSLAGWSSLYLQGWFVVFLQWF